MLTGFLVCWLDWLVRSAGPHPNRPFVHLGPCEEAARKFFDWSNPARGVLMLDQPRSHSIRSLFVVNFSGDERKLRREKAVTAAQNVVFAAFNINFDQLRCRSAARDEIVQRDCRYINQLSASENGALPVHLDSALSPLLSSAPKGDAFRGIGPHCARY